MAVVQNIKEKVHLPIYDSLTIEPGKQLRDAESSSAIKFFVNVQGKTKLETNLQSASLLPHYNTFEARAMRVVISDLPAEFSDKVEVAITNGNATPQTLKTDLARAMELRDEARDVDPPPQQVTVLINANGEEVDTGGTAAVFTLDEIETAILDLESEAPAPEQFNTGNGSGTIIGKLVYNTVTSFYVGEKLMIQMPTWFFPGGAGPFSSNGGGFLTHGEPTPVATFRFAEPIFIDRQQNFRVEIEVPDSDTLKEIQQIYGPLFIWVVLDGYMTRDVQ